MKTSSHIIAAFAVLAASLPAPPAARAQGGQADAHGQVDLEYFQEALAPSGEWMESVLLGAVWQPKEAAEKTTWKPYSNGSWSYTDQGWMWISNEDHGWATYHYGRWANLEGVGWAWVPGYEWAPSWVSWRTSPELDPRANVASAPAEAAPAGDTGRAAPAPAPRRRGGVIGWAPLPPAAVLDPEEGLSQRTDETCDIGPAAYSFVPAENFGDENVGASAFTPEEAFMLIERTLNITNMAYLAGSRNVFAGGPSYEVMRDVAARPVPLYAVARRPGEDLRGRPSPDQLRPVVKGRTIVVAAPVVNRPPGKGLGAIGAPASFRPAGARPLPATVRLNRGWQARGVSPAAISQARESVRRQAETAPARALRPAPLPATAIPGRGAASLPAAPRGGTAADFAPRSVPFSPASPARPVATAPSRLPPEVARAMSRIPGARPVVTPLPAPAAALPTVPSAGSAANAAPYRPGEQASPGAMARPGVARPAGGATSSAAPLSGSAMSRAASAGARGARGVGNGRQYYAGAPRSQASSRASARAATRTYRQASTRSNYKGGSAVARATQRSVPRAYIPPPAPRVSVPPAPRVYIPPVTPLPRFR